MSDIANKIAQLSPQQRELFLLRLKQRSQERAEDDLIQPLPREAADYDVSHAQERFWFLDRLRPGNPADHIPGTLKLEGALDVQALQRSFQRIVERHEALRTRFIERGGQPRQVFLPTLDLRIPLIDISALEPKAQVFEAGRLEAGNHREPFDLTAPPLLRLRLVRLDPEVHLLLVTFHHIVADGWSLGVLVQEVMGSYHAFRSGQDPRLPPLAIQYADFALWQRDWLTGQAMIEQLTFWKDKLEGKPQLFELPTDRPRPSFQSHRGARYRFAMSMENSSALSGLCRQEGATPFMALLAIYQVLLYRHARQKSFLIGTPIANRNRPEIEPLIGFFVNMLALPADFHGISDFRTLLRQVKDDTLEAFARQELPFEKLVEELQPERDPSRSPIFQVMFVLQNVPVPRTEVSGLTLSADDVDYGTSQYDLSLSLFEGDDGNFGWFEYNTDLYDRTTIHRLGTDFGHILEQVLEWPDRSFEQIGLPPVVRHQLLHEWNDTQTPIAEVRSVDQVLGERAASCRDAVAVIAPEGTLSFGELSRRATALSGELKRRQIGPETVVAVYAERCAEAVLAPWAIWLAGGVYLPIDPEYPDDRVAFMLEDSGARTVLCGAPTGAAMSESDVLGGMDTCLLAEDWPADPAAAAGSWATTVPALAAYMIYTSGSTGRPKGAVVSHGALRNHLEWRRRYFELEADDRILQKTSIGFDTSLWELLEPLYSGAAVVLAEPGGHRDSAYLVEVIRQHRVTALDFVPSMLPLFLAEAGLERCLSMKRINTGGEALTSDLERRLFKALPIVVCNGYGPTEACIGVSYCIRNRAGDAVVPIGRAISNTALEILDRQGRPVPLGMPGELVIRGEALARGYLNRPRLTAECFVPDANSSGGRAYRTGDLVRYRGDGQAEFIGRVDHQVKVRGYRVELGEIEAVLQEQRGVEQAVVLARQEPGAIHQQLIAYVVLADGAELRAQRQELAQTLPDYMVPALWVEIDAVPFTANGKIDRKALPDPNPSERLRGEYVAPRTPVEELLSEIWADLLSLGRVGIYDNFFELGGHSLLAIQMISRARESLNVDVALRELFRHPAVADLAQLIAHLKGRQGDNVEIAVVPRIDPDRAALHEPFPLADVQQAYWVGRSRTLELGGVAAHSYSEFEGRGWDLPRLNRAIQRLVERHAMLRAIVLDDGMQRILDRVPPYEIAIHDLRGKTPDEVEEGILALRNRMSHQIIPADRWPLFEVCASLLDDGLVRLHVSIDGLIRDAWSARLLWSQMAQYYLDPDLELPEIELSFRDCVLAKHEMREQVIYQRSIDYWEKRIPTLPPAPDVPMVRNLATVREPKFVRRWDRLPPEDWEKIKNLGTRLGLTPTVIVLTAFSKILATWSRTRDFTLNLTLFNRHPFHPQVGEIVGDFTSLIMVEVNEADLGNFAELGGRVQERLWEDLDHSYVSGVWVLRELARTRREVPRAYMPVVFTSTLALTETVIDTSNALEELPEVEMAYGISQTPQVTIDHQVAEQDGALVFIWDVVEDLFPPGLIPDMFESFHRLLQELAQAESRWHEPFSLIPDAHRALREKVNETAAPMPTELLQQLFWTRVDENPDALAVLADDRSLTYGELRQRASQVAHWLRDQGAEPNRLIAVAMEKGWEQVVAVLAILEAGGAYLPIDAKLPLERRDYLLAHGEVDLVLTQSRCDGGLWPEPVRRLAVDSLDGIWDAPPLKPIQTQHDLAYVIYTSGSTGKPKGVMIDHRGAVNTILDVNQRFQVGPKDRVLALSALNFDLSVYDIFGLLGAGGALVMPPENARREPAAWAKLIQQYQVTLWNSVPALLDILVEWAEGHDGGQVASLRQVLLSGDWIPLNLPERLRRLAPGAEVTSLGGATEASIWSIFYPIGEVDAEWKSIPYGKPMVNQTFHVLDRELRPSPNWIPGDLYIGGIGVALGYWRDEEKTQDSFIVHPRSGERLYRTGDLGRYLDDGNIEFLGREDLQVKVQGHRIELGEIEAALKDHPAIDNAVVNAVGTRHNKRLAGYLVPAQSTELPEQDALRQYLRTKLPDYMVPGVFMELDAFPLSANGKVDRKALPEISTGSSGASANRKLSSISRRIAELVAEVLGLEAVDPNSNLIELGGSSIEIVRIANRLEDEFGFRPPMDEMFRLSIDGAIGSFYEERLEHGEVYETTSPQAAQQADLSLLSSFSMIRDPDERERFKKTLPGLRSGLAVETSLALPGPELDETLRSRYLKRRSRRTFSQEVISQEAFGYFLSVLRQVSLDGQSKYLYASAGGLYPLQTYLYVKPDRVEGVEGGVHYYDPVGHQLVTMQAGIELDRGIHGWINQPTFDQSAFSIFLIAQMKAIVPMYGAQSLEFCAIEAGLIAQLLDDTAHDCGLGLCQIGGLRFEEIRAHFALDEHQQYVYSLLGGRLDPETEVDVEEQAELSDWEEGAL